MVCVADQKRELFDGLIRIHVLLHGLEKSGLLCSAFEGVEGRRRRVYRITAAGKQALEKAREKVDELYDELHEEHPRKVTGEGVSARAHPRT